MATVCTDALLLQLAQLLPVTARSTLVFRPPHRPLSVETTMMPAAFTSFVFMNACVYSGLALPRLAAMLRTFSL
jgi:hypothetical protein